MNYSTSALAPDRVRIFYSAIKHGYRCFISILSVPLLYAALVFILTGCCLVKRTVISNKHGPRARTRGPWKQPYINGYIIHSSFPPL